MAVEVDVRKTTFMMEISRSDPESMVKINHLNPPPGIIVSDNVYGKCLIATSAFKKGDFIYEGYYFELPAGFYKLDIGGSELINVNSVHSVQNPHNGLRQVYGFDGFINHSCDANLYCPSNNKAFTAFLQNNTIAIAADGAESVNQTLVSAYGYNAYVIKDISPGDEVTCNYSYFDYECNGHEIPVCQCGSSKCRGSMTGFKNLSIEDKAKALRYVDITILKQFLADNPKIEIIEVKSNPYNSMPSTVKIVQTYDEYGNVSFFLQSNGCFKKGDIIFRNHIRKLYNDKPDDQIEIIVKIGEDYKLLNKAEHFIHRRDYVEFLGFDHLMNHSCDPTTYQTYVSEDEYIVYANRDITVGEDLTCNYSELNNQASSAESIVTIRFQCECGSANCRGFVNG